MNPSLCLREQLECDGVEVVVPPDTEGILILNIPSYMGGVNIWASGDTLFPPSSHHLHSSLDMRICNR